MSKVSKKINEIKDKLDSISGLDDDYVYSWIESIDKIVTPIVDICSTWSEEEDEKGTIFYKKRVESPLKELFNKSED